MMHEMMDMGQKSDMGMQPTEGKEKTRITYHSFSIRGDALSEEMKRMEIGDECRCEVVLKKIGDGIDTYAEGKPRRVEVEIRKMGYLSKAGGKTFDEYDKSSKEEKKEHDKETAGVDKEEGEE